MNATPPSETLLRDEVRRVLAEIGDPDVPLPDDADAFAAGVLQSLNLVELITCLEDAYALEITQRDVFDGHLRSIDSIVRLVLDRAGATT